MSSLPSISHHLFVAAVRHDGRPSDRPPRNQNIPNSSDQKLVPTETPSYTEELDHAMADPSGSFIE